MKDTPFTEARLLSLYDRVAEAEDAIPRLRRFVLDLAVRGKLVLQDAADEPASELVERIENEQARLVRSKEIKKPKSPEPVDAFVEPFILPSAWVWSRLDSLSPTSLVDGDWIETKDQSETGTVRLIQLADVGVGAFLDKSARFITEETEVRLNCTRLRVGDVLIARLPNPIGRACIFPDIGQPAITVVDVAILRPTRDVFGQYIVTAMNAPAIRAQIESYGKGATRFRVSTGHLKTVQIPLPPLAEQHRIVAKVEEMMALLDRLEAARAAREETRTRLTAATLSRLTETDTDTAARFALQTLPALTTRPDQIKTLRQTILNLAVRGKLVEQDAGDEPASDLMKRISTIFSEKIAKGELNKPKTVGPVPPENELFITPSSWKWARFAKVASIESNLVDPKHYLDMPHVAPDNIQSWTGRLLPYTSVREAGVFSGKHLFKSGVLLYSKIRPNLAKVTKVDFEGLCSADMYPIFPLIDRDFLLIFMITPHFVNQAVSEDNRVAMPKINQAALSEVIVPVPPLAEQRRIVAKVEELMSLCDRLERALQDATTTRARLLDATLREALAEAQESA